MDEKTLIYEFGQFQMDLAQRILLRHGEPVNLTPKGFDLLLFLVQNNGRVLEKDEFMQALWPESFVEEGNLSQNIFVLRKTLGDDQNGNCFIQTIPRRGYKFVASVKQSDSDTPGNGFLHRQNSSLPLNYWKRHTPFRSLQAFEPEDSWLFFGRDSETEDLLLRLSRSPVLAVIGNSGCGKSSLVRAGLIPALAAGRFGQEDASANAWHVAIFRPSGAPFDYLAEVLPNQLAPELSLREQAEFIADCRNKFPFSGEALRNAISALANVTVESSGHAHILLVADQFEELFTLTTDQETRKRYIDALLTASRLDSPVPVRLVLVLRADFYSHCLEHPELSRCLENNLYNVPRMTPGQLREAIEKRLHLAGAKAEPGLVDSLLEDAGTEPGNLALLEHALAQLWERCGGAGCSLTSQAYSEIGRLRGALGRYANEIYEGLGDDDRKRLARNIFMELVHLGEGAQDTRRRIRKADLLALGAADEVEQLLAELVSSRLITTGEEHQEEFVEVSHEALIREWPLMRDWLAQNREELRLARRLLQAAEEWSGLNRDPGALLQGARLAQGEESLGKHPNVPMLVGEFLQASIEARTEATRKQREDEEWELARQRLEALQARRSAVRLRWFSAALAMLLLVAIGTAWYAYRLQVIEKSRALAAQAEELLPRDHGRALDLALHAWDVARTQEARLAVTKTFPDLLALFRHDGPLSQAIFSPDGKRILTASYDHTASIWDSADGHRLVVLLGHTDKIYAAEFSPDGQLIVTAGEDHTARLWRSNDGALLAVLPHKAAVREAQFSPDGQLIVTASQDHLAQVWASADGHRLAILHGHTERIWEAKFSPDSKFVVTAGWDNTARLWSSANGQLLAILQHNGTVMDARFSPDGQHILTASYDHTAQIWNTATGQRMTTLSHDGGVIHCVFSRDGQRIATTSLDHTARIWDAKDGQLLATLNHDGVVGWAEFSPDGKHIVTASQDRTARLWNTTDGHLLAIFTGPTGSVWEASFSPDGQQVLTAGEDGIARLWNTTGGRALAVLAGHTDGVGVAAFSPNGQLILTAGPDGAPRVWNAADGRLVTTLSGQINKLWIARFSPDGRRIITGGLDHIGRVWNASDGRLLVTLTGHTDRIWNAAFSPDGQRVATASADRTARIWNATDGRLLTTLTGHTDRVWIVSFSPDGQLILTASLDHTARVWNVSDGGPLAVLQHNGKVNAAVFSRDGNRIVTASSDHTARVWSTSDGRPLATLSGHSDEVARALFSPDGQLILTGSLDHTARVWNASDARLVAILGHNGTVQAVAFSQDGKKIATATSDYGTAWVWNSVEGRLLATLQGHTAGILQIAFSPDGQRIVTASGDQTARIWQVLTFEDIDRILSH